MTKALAMDYVEKTLRKSMAEGVLKKFKGQLIRWPMSTSYILVKNIRSIELSVFSWGVS